MTSTFHRSTAKRRSLLALAAACAFGSGAVHAAGTASGTTISNSASLSYSVGGVPQAAIGSSATGNTTGAGTATTFVVDNKVNLNVTASAITTVGPGTTGRVTTFTVTNTGNTVQGYTLAAANVGGGDIAGTADSIDVSNFSVFVDANGNGTYEPGTDTATSIASLPADASVAVFVLADVPATATNGQQANVSLTATTTAAGSTTALAQTAGANTAGVDVVFADAATTESGFVGTSAARDGQGTARNAYRVASSSISVAKTAALICDPFNGTTNQKSIPGSIVRYTITVTNTAGAGASATLTQLTDALDTNTVFDPNHVTGGGLGTTATNCNSATGVPDGATGRGFRVDVTNDARSILGGGVFPIYLTTGADGDGATHSAGTVTIDYSQALPAGGLYGAGELKAGESVTVQFNVTIQ